MASMLHHSRSPSSTNFSFCNSLCAASSACEHMTGVFSPSTSVSSTTSSVWASSADSPPAHRMGTTSTCAYPSWPASRSLSSSSIPTISSAASSRPTTPSSQYTDSPLSFASPPSRSPYSCGASAYISDDDLLDFPVQRTPTRFIVENDNDADDCIAPGYHLLSRGPGKPRESRFGPSAVIPKKARKPASPSH